MAFMKSIQALGKQSKKTMKILNETTPVKPKKEIFKYEETAVNYENSNPVTFLKKNNIQSSDSQDDCAPTPAKFMMFHKNKVKAAKPKKIKVTILSDRFEPAEVKIEKGQTVEWSLKFALEENHSSLYHMKNRTHVVSFDKLPEESGLMRTVTDSFKVRFFEPGVFTYRCSIYTRMVGKIVVTEPAKDIKESELKDFQAK